MNKIIDGKYKNGLINNNLQVIAFRHKTFTLSDSTVKSINLIDSDSSKSLGSIITRGAVGAVTLGTLGMLGGIMTSRNKNTHTIKIIYHDDSYSIVEINDKILKKLQVKFA